MKSPAWWPTMFVLAIATFTDLRSRRIPNWLVLPFLLTGVVVSGWLHGWQGLGQSAAGIGLGILVYGSLFWIGAMGGGDVKLCAAIGAWVGPGQLLIAIVMAGVIGGVMVLCWAAFDGFLSDLLHSTGGLLLGRNDGGVGVDDNSSVATSSARKIAYAPAIAIGTLLSFFGR